MVPAKGLASPDRRVYSAVMDEIDPHTLRVAADLVRGRMKHLHLDPRMDGLQRLGAARVLRQLAIDLDVSAEHVGKPARLGGRPIKP